MPGTDLDHFIVDRIARLLGMTSTEFYVTEANKDRISEPHTDSATGQRPLWFNPLEKPVRISGGGGVQTAGDYLRQCRMFLNGRKGDNVRLLAPSASRNDPRSGWRLPQSGRSKHSFRPLRPSTIAHRICVPKCRY
jgi:CubicO group peptidase (beta-lactamase class C family)